MTRDWLGEAHRIAAGSMLPPQHQHITALAAERDLLSRALLVLTRELERLEHEQARQQRNADNRWPEMRLS